MKILLDVGKSRMFDGKRVHWAKRELINMWKAGDHERIVQGVEIDQDERLTPLARTLGQGMS